MATVHTTGSHTRGRRPGGQALDSRLQDGIYHRKGEAPPSSYRLLLLNVKPDTGIGEARTAIARIWAMLQELRDRNLATDVRPDPPPARRPNPSRRKDPDECKPCTAPKLTCLLGFGASLFDRYHPRMPRPDQLLRLDQGPFRKIRWVAKEEDRQTGEADLALQFIAWTELAVNRAVAEVWMMIVEQFLPLEIVAVHGGFNREDKRSWIGFHDGISNIKADRRPAVITATSEQPAWMEGGTYMAFFRLAIDLERWRRLPLKTQELLVGRDKLTGSPLEPAGPGLPISRKGSPIFGDPAFKLKHISPPAPPMTASVLLASHMHRANPNRRDPILEEDNRIFRQGYEFLEQLHDGRLRLGINFVSFQGRLSRVRNMLSKDGWLGDVNFGGCPFTERHAPGPIVFVEMIAGGYYAVPPKGGDAESFPGWSIF
jgi:deferrochelatase/peroxidase EfeB